MALGLHSRRGPRPDPASGSGVDTGIQFLLVELKEPRLFGSDLVDVDLVESGLEIFRDGLELASGSEAQVDQLGCIPCDDVVVDASGLTVLDAVGANVFHGLYHYVNGRGARRGSRGRGVPSPPPSVSTPWSTPKRRSL